MVTKVHVLSGDITTNVFASQSNESWVLTGGSGIYSNKGLIGAAAAAGQNFLINGAIVSNKDGLTTGTQSFDAVNISTSGTIQAGHIGLNIQSAQSTGTNDGLIYGDFAGVLLNGQGNVFLNNGTIGGGGTGIKESHLMNQVDVFGVTITNTGDIASFRGIQSSGDQSMIDNSGSITASGNGESAISTNGAQNSIVNSGTIVASLGAGIFDTSTGASSVTAGAVISNSGTINANFGIRVEGSYATIENLGAIATSGIGVVMRGTSDYFTNSGSIVDNGPRGHGVKMLTVAGETQGFMNLSGGTVAAQSGLVVIGGEGEETIVNFGTITGRIDTQGGNDTVANHGNIIGDILTLAGNDVVRVMHGTVTGNIDLGADDDVFRLSHGSVLGSVAGGDGNDTYIVDGDTVNLVETTTGGVDQVRSSANFTLGANLENLTLTGSNDINGHGNDAANTIKGNSGANLIAGHGGNDTLSGGNGNDTLRGGTGDDRLDGQHGDDRILGGWGNDTITDLTGDNTIKGGAGDDRIFVADGANQISGGAGNDSLSYSGATQSVTLDLGSQANNAGAAAGSTISGIQSIHGSLFGDSITGSAADDALYGDKGRDTLVGGDGNDLLYGQIGADTLIGGLGADTFVYQNVRDSVAARHDLIEDFTQFEDRIDLSAIDADTGTLGNGAFTFISTAAFSGRAGELNQITAGGETIIQGDINGDGVADLSIHLTGTIMLAAADFIL